MPINPFISKNAIICKVSPMGNEPVFSTGKPTANIIAWEVWNRTVRRGVVYSTKITNDETQKVFRTHDPIAAELQSDDSLTFDNYTYTVVSVQPIKTALNWKSQDYEISVK